MLSFWALCALLEAAPCRRIKLKPKVKPIEPTIIPRIWLKHWCARYLVWITKSTMLPQHCHMFLLPRVQVSYLLWFELPNLMFPYPSYRYLVGRAHSTQLVRGHFTNLWFDGNSDIDTHRLVECIQCSILAHRFHSSQSDSCRRTSSQPNNCSLASQFWCRHHQRVDFIGKQHGTHWLTYHSYWQSIQKFGPILEPNSSWRLCGIN